MRLSGKAPKPKPKTDKEKIADLKQQLAIEKAVGQVQEERAKDNLVAKKDHGKGGKPGDGSTAPRTSLRPKLRPKEKMMGGGMATKKKSTGYMYGGMAKKPKGKK